MSDLWDYDDDDDQDNGGGWEVPPPEKELEEDKGEEQPKKRKGGRKPASKAGKGAKHRAVSPAADLGLRPVPLATAILLDSDDDDDLVLLPTPAGRGGPAGASGAAAAGQSNQADTVPAAIPAVSNLTPATQQTLAKEQELLRALQQVTEREHQQDDDDGAESSPEPSVSRLPALGMSRLTGRLPMAAADGGVADGAVDLCDDDDDDDVVLAANVRAPVGALPRMACGAPEPAGAGAVGGGGATAAAEGVAPTPAPAADRVQLKLVWGREKDDSLKMRVVKTDPFSKMIEKFREIAKERKLCADPKKIKFLFDGDNLATMADETPESLDMEDDMMIDVKL